MYERGERERERERDRERERERDREEGLDKHNTSKEKVRMGEND